MVWQEKDKMELRKEFVIQANRDEVNVSELCKRYRISRKTGYKWIARYRAGEGLEDKSRRPRKIYSKFLMRLP